MPARKVSAVCDYIMASFDNQSYSDLFFVCCVVYLEQADTRSAQNENSVMMCLIQPEELWSNSLVLQ